MHAGCKLTIETANVEHDPDYAREREATPVRRFVMLAVSDTGIGMDEATKARIFEPFFTTKEAGKGTGLGLATGYGIVQQSGGFIWVYSEPGQGATFKIYLPRVSATARQPTPTPASPGTLRGTETILLVEDEAPVRTVVRNVLQRYGYAILEAPDIEAAIAFGERHDGEIHLLLTDVVMPGLHGTEVAARVARARPNLRVIFMSGYTDDAVIRHGVLHPGVAYLQKPFGPEALARKVREVMDSSPASAAEEK